MLGKDLGQSKLGAQLRHLRQLDLGQIEKPKTLVILHYCGKRISVPLFEEVPNLAQLLYHHIAKLEQTVLNNQPAWQKNSKSQIVCFEMKKENNQQFKPQRESDGDLRSNILLSLLRIEGRSEQQCLQELSFRVDVTKVYKYLEIQPFYRHFDQDQTHIYHNQDQLSQNRQFPYLQFYRILSQSRISTTFLARKVNNGHFYTVKVYASGSNCGLEDHKAILHMQNVDQMQKDTDIKCTLLVRSHQSALIPHPETEDEESDDQINCKYIALVSPFFPRGTLQEMLKDVRFSKSKRILEMDCLNYLKELMWGVHLLHEKYNLLHRSIVPSNLLIDQNGQLRLTTYFSCIPCYNTNGQYAKYTHKNQRSSSYYLHADLEEIFQNGQYNIGEYTPPEVLRGQPYNYLADYYSVGIIIRKLYQLSQAYERLPSQPNQNLMLTMIQRLTSSDLMERETIVSEIVQDIERQNLQGGDPPLGISSLILQDIKIGKQIELTESKKFIQNQELYNQVDIQIIRNYFKKPKIKSSLLKTQVKRSKKSKEKQSVKNSRQKSDKCFSKASAQSQNESKTQKKKVGSISKQSLNSHSREKKILNYKKDISLQSPSHKKPSKSRSNQKKRKEQQNQSTKVYNHHQDDQPRHKQSHIPILPKSPKNNINIAYRAKSPQIRDKIK